MTRSIVFASFILALAACASPENRLEAGLREAGLSQRQSACMADRMAGKLSIGQLLKLRSLGNFQDERVGDMGMKRFLKNIRALEDPEILAITTRAALGCAISG